MAFALRPVLRTATAALCGLSLSCQAADSDVLRRDLSEGSNPDTAAPRTPASSDSDDRAAVVFLGTSLTAGFGLADPTQAYPALLQDRIDEQGLSFRAVNAGVSGDTSAGGLRRLAWLLQEPLSVLVLELGANDGLRGLSVDELRANLRAAIEETRTRYPDAAVVVVGMEAPPNLGSRYADAFRGVFPDVADAFDAALVPFLLEGVAGVPEMNQDDRIHPNPAGHRRVADNVWQILEPVLRRQAEEAESGA
jgi:acyl-CoA thioesterase-1